MSPLLPLSVADSIRIQEVCRLKLEIENHRRLVFEDIGFYLARLSGVFTGGEGLNFLPSTVAEMGRKWEERRREGGS